MSNKYIHTELIHNFSAPSQVVPIVIDLVKPKNVLDVGCGTGTWLKIFDELGITDYLGVDGDYVDQTLLKIGSDKFIAFDISRKLSLGRRFDLVISLEVAEHLPEAVADQFVASLVAHGDTILFSAAVPGQGGQHHVNEQWQQYWEEKFKFHGYYFHDSIRPLIWNNPKVDWWYKQNIFLVKKGVPSQARMISVVHPELFEKKQRTNLKYLESLLSGKEGMRVGIEIFFNALILKLKKIFPRRTS